MGELTPAEQILRDSAPQKAKTAAEEPLHSRAGRACRGNGTEGGKARAWLCAREVPRGEHMQHWSASESGQICQGATNSVLCLLFWVDIFNFITSKFARIAMIQSEIHKVKWSLQGEGSLQERRYPFFSPSVKSWLVWICYQYCEIKNLASFIHE